MTDEVLIDPSVQGLKRRTARGAFFSVGGQAASFAIRTGSMVVLARLLTPKDFGLVGMVTAVTGFLSLFKDAGLSAATVQRASVTEAQTSTLFWLNTGLGAVFALACIALAPALTVFYSEPRLFWMTVASGATFLLAGTSAQHRAMLQRKMQFAVLASIDVFSLIVSVGVGIGFALAGFRYWALVLMAVSATAAGTLGAWLASGWLPGRPQRRSGIRGMLQFGGALTLNNLLVYVAYNADKVLLGRFWGADVLGMYGRAYQLVTVPNDNLFASVGSVAFPALSQLQGEPAKLRSYFLKGYTLFLSLVVPVTAWCALFADDIVLTALGPKWREVASIFRWLAPTTLAFGMANPFSWLMLATGHAGRCIRICLVVTPLIILGYGLGLSHGAQGVAIGFSSATVLSMLPVIAWSKHGTLISMADVFRAAARPWLSVVAAVAVALTLQALFNSVHPAFMRLIAKSGIFFGVYFIMLLSVMGQMTIYVDLLRQTGVWPVGVRLKQESLRR